MNWLASIAEERIRDAIRDGQFERLPGSGKPLNLEDDAMVPEELRISYRLLKNAGMIPEEMQLRKDMVTIGELLACCRDEGERGKLQSAFTAKKLRYQAMMGDRGWDASGVFAEYERQIQERLTQEHKPKKDAESEGRSGG